MPTFIERIRLPGPVSRSVLLLLVAATAAAAACGSEGPAGLVVGGGDPGGGLDLTVEVAPDSTVYDWDGRPARLLEVENRDDGEVVWRIVAGTDEGFAPPVVHGEAPAAADEEVAAQILVTGVTHRVTLEALDGTTQTETFTP